MRKLPRMIGLFLFLIGLFNAAVFSQAIQSHSLAEAMMVQSKYEAALFQNPNVRAVGIGRQNDTQEWIVSVYVSPGTVPSEIPATLDDFPVRVKESGAIYALDGGAAHRRQQGLPVLLGASTSNTLGCLAGTLGFKVCDSADPSVTGYVTNNHVAVAAGSYLCPNEAPRWSWQSHLGRYDLDCRPNALIIGFLERFVRINFRGENRVDAAFVKEFGANTVSEEILDIGFPTRTPRNADVGDMVRKSGRTTGDTTSQVTEVNATVEVSYGSCGTTFFTGQVIADNAAVFVDAGDSGSPVVDASNNPVGLVFAGSDEVAVFNSISEVMTLLNVQMDCDY
ncbi:MAG: trypsin-like serine protease [Acidobacteria bacterium]|nr:trypsin-like serine protease [Acidobacteriota bacterium]MBI3655732.1 trypsin-like serine protease [Acidobacteriota bacterium]